MNKVKKSDKKPDSDLVDDILNGTSANKKSEDELPVNKKKVEPKVVKLEPAIEKKIEPEKEVVDVPVSPDKKKSDIPPIAATKGGIRLVNESLPGRLVQGSIGHDLTFKIQLDEKGVSEPIHDERIVEKLLSCGFKVAD